MHIAFVRKKMEKVRVQIVGLSEVKSAEGIYWLLFKEIDGDRHAPILIGKTEAQAITVSLQHADIPVKLTHQLFAEIALQFGIKLTEVVIFSNEDKPFSALLTWDNGHTAYHTESRASDGVALALHFGVPIYMDADIFQKVSSVVTKRATDAIEDLSDDDLNDLLQQLLANEEYEQAAKVRDEISKRKDK